MNLKTSQIIQINQNYGSHRKSEVTDNHGRHIDDFLSQNLVQTFLLKIGAKFCI